MGAIAKNNVIKGASRSGLDLLAESSKSAFGMRVARATYSFAVEGGTQGAISLLTTGQGTIPANSIILGGVLEVTTALTGVGASVAISVEGANDIVSAAAISGAPWSTTGRKSIVPAFTGATSVKTTAARNVVATVTAADLTAGVFNVYLFYVVVA